jgi:hypothetical protein
MGEALRELAESAPDAGQKSAAEGAADSAKNAEEALRDRDYGRAGDRQEEVLRALEALSADAEKAAERAAGQSQEALERARVSTGKAAESADRIAGGLREGARSAHEDSARARLEEAAGHTETAAEALRRSLRRLKESLPKPAGQDRREASEEARKARESVRGVRERQQPSSDAQRDAMRALAEQQKELEDETKRLEEVMRKSKEPSGVERLEDAQSAMREAKRALEQGEQDEAEEAQERARKSLEEARREMDKEERRYRSLRQYELLFQLKEALQGFRRDAQASLETLQQIDAVARNEGKVSRHLDKSQLTPLREGVARQQRDVADKAAAIEKEQAIVYTYLLQGCGNDLGEVIEHLRQREVGVLPQEILADVVRRFDLALKGLERDLREKREEEGQQQDPPEEGSQPMGTKQRLVPPDAELRMVKVLQEALNAEREAFFRNRPDFATRKATEAEQARIQRLYHQQGSLAELFDTIREALARGARPPAEGEEGHE